MDNLCLFIELLDLASVFICAVSIVSFSACFSVILYRPCFLF